MSDIVFHEIAWLLLAAAGVGVLGAALRQPLIVSFIIVGILVGAFFPSSPQTGEQIAFLAELGIALLLFLVGLKLDWRVIRELGTVSIATGLGQVGFTAAIGFLIGIALGIDMLTSLYVAVALTFSSTIIIVKLLTDKRELDTLHGRIAVGFLIVQDIVVVIAMVVLSAIGIGTAEGSAGLSELWRIFGTLVVAGVLLVLFVRYVADPLTSRLARIPELLLVFAIGWAAATAAVAEGAGLGKEIGGLAAGVSLGSTAFRDMISARLAGLRDFLLLFFFLSLGVSLEFAALGENLGSALVFAAFVLLGNPLIVLLIMVWMGYRARTGFLAGLTVAQISEFSLIFMAMGVSLGHVNQAAVGLVTLVGLVTIATSVYMITYSHQLHERVAPLLKWVDVRGWREAGLGSGNPERPVDVILFGLGRFGGQLLTRLNAAGLSVLGIDLDPRVVRRWNAAGYRACYGDVTEQEFWSELPLTQARWLILTVPYGAVLLTETDARSGLLAAARSHGFAGHIALTVRDEAEAQRISEGDVVLVLHPFDDAAEMAAKRITDVDFEVQGQLSEGTRQP